MTTPQYKAILVGCGSISKAWLKQSSGFDDLRIAGYVDLNIEQAKLRRSEFGPADAYVGTSLTDALKNVKAEIMFDCTIPEAHSSTTIEALNAGLHVLGEKPMADTMANAKRMVDAAKANKRRYAVIQNRRYMDNTVAYRDMVQSGALGELTALTSDFFIGAHFGGFRDSMEHVLLLDMAIHTFDMARFISGKDAVSVYAREWNPKGSWYKHGASALCVFEMTGGSVYTYQGSWCAEGMNTSWEAVWRAVGTKGSAVWDGKDGINGQTVAKTGSFISEMTDLPKPSRAPLKHTFHAGVIREFLDSLASGKTPQTDCEDNIKSLAMVHAAIESAVSGKTVKV